MVLEKKFYKKIESYMYSHYEDLEEMQTKEQDIIYGCKALHLGEETGASLTSSNTSKVEDAALKLIDLHDEKKSKWIKVISESIEDFKGTEYEMLVDLTYNKQYQMPKIWRLLHLEKSTYYNKKDDVIMHIALKAASKGLIENKLKKVVE